MRMLGPISTDWSWPRRSLSPARMGDVFEDFDRIVDSFLRPTFATTINFQPSCDVNETKDHYLVSFDMPGVKKEDIKIEVQGNQLVISGERQREVNEENGEATLHHERMYGRFERTFTLPATIAADKIEAHYENGVLNVALPKAETAKGRTIQIQTGQGGLLSKLLGAKKEANKELKDVKVS
jgi:HSP20 family protein